MIVSGADQRGNIREIGELTADDYRQRTDRGIGLRRRDHEAAAFAAAAIGNAALLENANRLANHGAPRPVTGDEVVLEAQHGAGWVLSGTNLLLDFVGEFDACGLSPGCFHGFL